MWQNSDYLEFCCDPASCCSSWSSVWQCQTLVPFWTWSVGQPLPFWVLCSLQWCTSGSSTWSRPLDSGRRSEWEFPCFKKCNRAVLFFSLLSTHNAKIAVASKLLAAPKRGRFSPSVGRASPSQGSRLTLCGVAPHLCMLLDSSYYLSVFSLFLSEFM